MHTNTETTLDADIALIAHEAANDEALKVDAAPSVDEQGNVIAPPEPVDYAVEATSIVEFAFASFEPLYPSITPIYTPDKREKIAAAAAPLMEKYGLTLGGFFAKWGPEIAFLMVTLPVVIPTYKAVLKDNADAKKEAGTLAKQPIEKSGMQPIIDQTDPGSLHNKL